MVAAELETLARLDLDVTVVVFNDATLTLIELKQPPGADPGAVAYRPTDFAAVARAMGVPAAIATTSAQLHDQLTGVPPGAFPGGRPDRSPLLPPCPRGHPRRLAEDALSPAGETMGRATI